jgi:aminoglycoside phosphotransferase (APT) family kinase protein
MLGGGKVNRSFLVRTRRGRFVVRLNESASADSGLDRDRELLLQSAAANAGIAPHVIYACPDRSCLITDYVEGRLWTSHYFTRMRDLRALGQRLRSLHALVPPPLPRFVQKLHPLTRGPDGHAAAILRVGRDLDQFAARQPGDNPAHRWRLHLLGCSQLS